jgi:hypothetical protein
VEERAARPGFFLVGLSSGWGAANPGPSFSWSGWVASALEGSCSATSSSWGFCICPSKLRGRLRSMRSMKRAASLRFRPVPVGVEPTGVALLDIWKRRGVWSRGVGGGVAVGDAS